MKPSVQGARIVNGILGIWLVLSSLLWPHTSAQFANAWLVGVFIVLTAVSSMWAPSLRYVNSILAVWLFLSPWALHGTATGTLWNNVVVAVAVFSFSLVPHEGSWLS